ncbi:hypothetical protein JCM8547_008931 [Rhodosporidiobolus lusitaniae]
MYYTDAAGSKSQTWIDNQRKSSARLRLKDSYKIDFGPYRHVYTYRTSASLRKDIEDAKAQEFELKHPNHGAYWTKEEDARVWAWMTAGKDEAVLGKELGRTAGAVRSRWSSKKGHWVKQVQALQPTVPSTLLPSTAEMRARLDKLATPAVKPAAIFGTLQR